MNGIELLLLVVVVGVVIVLVVVVAAVAVVVVVVIAVVVAAVILVVVVLVKLTSGMHHMTKIQILMYLTYVRLVATSICYSLTQLPTYPQLEGTKNITIRS